MKKKFLTLTCFLLLNSISYASPNNDLPALPVPENLVTESKSDTSFWSKTLNFLGLGDEKKKETKTISNENLQSESSNPKVVTTAVNTNTTDTKLPIPSDTAKQTPLDLKIPDIKPDETASPDNKDKPATDITNGVPTDTKLPTPSEIAKQTPLDLKIPDIKPDERLTPDNQVNNEKVNVKSYRQHLQERLDKSKKLPKIQKKDLVQADLKEDPEQIKFTNDEAQVLLLPNDEVVLGEVTKQAQIDLMDLSSYIALFWENYDNIKEEPARELINNFIDGYDNNFNIQPLYNKKDLSDIFSEALKAIDKNSIYDLMNLLDIYPILQLADHQGNTLLHKSVYKNNYLATKFLIMKGIDISAQNNKNLTALDIAIAQKKSSIITLLKTAGAKSLSDINQQHALY